MIYYLVIEGKSSFIIKKFDKVLALQHAYENFYMIKVDKLTKQQQISINQIGWTFYAVGEKH